VTAAIERGQLLQEMGAARSRVMEAVRGLDDEQASRPEIDGWSVKDQLIHLTVCDEIRFHEIGRVSRGGEPGYANLNGERMDVFNETVVDLRRSLSRTQVLDDLAAARLRVLEAIDAAPERALATEVYGDGYPVNGSINHDNEHAAAISHWRKRVGL
jgi:Mycothiol maleylpyruvate isomerase N-terminal domain